MTGVALRYDLSQVKGVSRRLNRALAEAGDAEPLLDEIGASLVTSTQIRFERGQGPDGKPWKPSARGGQTLVDTGRLLGSVTHRVSGRQVEVGTNVLYGAIHQFGGTIRPKAAGKLRFTIGSEVIFADKVEMPARPYLGIDAGDEAEIAAIVNDHLSGAFG